MINIYNISYNDIRTGWLAGHRRGVYEVRFTIVECPVVSSRQQFCSGFLKTQKDLRYLVR